MNNVKELLTSALNPQVRLMQETRNLRDKWDKTGLLEGLTNDIDRSNMSILLENQAKQLIEESTSTGTSANSEQWAGVALPLVRRVFAEFAAKEFVSVQPMNLPSGLIFYLDFKYGTNQGAIVKDSATVYDSLFGGTGTKTGSTDSAVGGLYGAGRFAYSINDKVCNCNVTSSVVLATMLDDLNWNYNWDIQAAKSGSTETVLASISRSVVNSEIIKITTTNFATVAAAQGNVFDTTAIRSFVPSSGSLYEAYFPALTKLSGNEVVFIVSASLTGVTSQYVTASNAVLPLAVYTEVTGSGTLTSFSGSVASSSNGLGFLNSGIYLSGSFQGTGIGVFTASYFSGSINGQANAIRYNTGITGSTSIAGVVVGQVALSSSITNFLGHISASSVILTSVDFTGWYYGGEGYYDATHVSMATINYSVQPKDSNRGDFEDADNSGDTGKFNLPGASTTDTGLNKDIGIPEVNLELKSEPIVAKTRKLKAVWTPELAQDLNAYHSIDAEAELTSLLSEYVSMEIDLEILDMLIVNVPAVTTERWSAKLNREIIPDGASGWTYQDQTVAGTGGYYEKSTWYRTLGIKCQKVSNKIHQLTLRGGANFMVCSPDVATILESIPGFTVNTDGDQAKFAMGVTRVGTFAQRFQVYKNPYMTDNVILMGFRGNNFLETGAVYAPYVPLVQTPLVYDPVNFTPRRGVMTRYAKKIVRPEFYGKILVADLDQV